MHLQYFSFISLLVILSWATSILCAPSPRDDPGPGIELTNAGKATSLFTFWEDFSDGVGTASPNFVRPNISTTLAAGQSTFVGLPLSWKGRVQRGNFPISTTWVEFQIQATTPPGTPAADGNAHGDVSLEKGCDVPATIESTDGTGPVPAKAGFDNTVDVFAGAPPEAMGKRPDNIKALDTTMGNWQTPAPGNGATYSHLSSIAALEKLAYIRGGTGIPDIMSKNNRLKVVFYSYD